MAHLISLLLLLLLVVVGGGGATAHSITNIQLQYVVVAKHAVGERVFVAWWTPDCRYNFLWVVT